MKHLNKKEKDVLNAFKNEGRITLKDLAKKVNLPISSVNKIVMRIEDNIVKSLDKNDGIILNILQANCRTSLTAIAKQVNLSVDSVKQRIKKMENIIFYPKVQIRPRPFGFDHIVDVKIKLNNHSKGELDHFIDYLTNNPRVSEIFSVGGEYDLSIVIIAKDAADLGDIDSEINKKFGRIINSWIESTSLKAHKFEIYDMIKLINSV